MNPATGSYPSFTSRAARREGILPISTLVCLVTNPPSLSCTKLPRSVQLDYPPTTRTTIAVSLGFAAISYIIHRDLSIA